LAIYQITGVDPNREQPWNAYALSLLGSGFVSVVGLYLLQRLQGSCP
jgi:K+-transporting ATPase ATPase A chain